MEKNRKITRVAFVAEESLNYFFTLFVTSTFLGYLLSALGFSDATQGVINTVATLSCGAQLFSFVISGRRVKRTILLAMLFNQIAFIAIYLLPLFDFAPGVRSVFFVALLVIGNLVNNAVSPARLVWLMKSVDLEKRGTFTAVKEMISLAGGVVLSLSLGAIADAHRDADGAPTSTYYIICLVALVLMTALHTFSLLVCHEDSDEAPRVSVGESLKAVFKNESILKIMPISIIWQISLALSTPFYPSYLREELSMSFTLITVLTTVGLVARLVVSPFMGKLADKKSFTFSMMTCVLLQGIAYLGGIFCAPGMMKWFYLVYSCFSGFAMAGMNNGFMNLVYDFVRPEDRSVTIGLQSAVGGITGFLSALISGVILDKIQSAGGVTVFGVHLYAQQALSILSFITVLLLFLYMLKIIVPMKRIVTKSVEIDERL